MRAGQLKELIEILKGTNVDVRKFTHLLELEDKEVQAVLNLSYSTNDKFLVLLEFYEIYYEKGKELEDCMGHFEIDDLKKFFSEKIIASKYAYVSNICASLKNPQIDCNLFHSQEEYSSYLEVLSQLSFVPSRFHLDLKYLLKNIHLNREETLNLFFQYSLREFDQSQYTSIILKFKTLSEENASKPYIFRFLSLLSKGYQVNASHCFINKWKKELNEKENDSEVYKQYNLAHQFLLDFPHEVLNLPAVFCNANFENYSDIIHVIQDIFEKNSKNPLEMVRDYIASLPLSDSNNKICELNDITRKFLYTQNQDIISAFMVLLQGKYISNLMESTMPIAIPNIIDEIIKILEVASEEKKSVLMANLLLKISDFLIWKNISPYTPIQNFGVIYENYSLYVDRCIIEEGNLVSYKRLGKISQLSFQANQKILSLLDNLVFLDDINPNENPEKRDYLFSIIFEKENENCLDYIVEQYRIAEEARKQKEAFNKIQGVHLQTVNELIGKYPIDQILDGFCDDDKITPNTLIRSLKFKSSQN